MTLKQRLNRKLKKNGGFTLIEMLIVVAIIAILVVVSIPMVSSNLNEAKTAADAANFRAAKAAAMIEYMANDGGTGTAVYHYNATTGEAQDSTTGTKGITAYSQSEDGKYVKVTITDGVAEAIWEPLS